MFGWLFVLASESTKVSIYQEKYIPQYLFLMTTCKSSKERILSDL